MRRVVVGPVNDYCRLFRPKRLILRLFVRCSALPIRAGFVVEAEQLRGMSHALTPPSMMGGVRILASLWGRRADMPARPV
jgi:hypothetical protein